MGALLTSARESAIGDVCVDGGLRRDVESVNGARGGGACDRGAVHDLEILSVI